MRYDAWGIFRRPFLRYSRTKSYHCPPWAGATRFILRTLVDKYLLVYWVRLHKY